MTTRTVEIEEAQGQLRELLSLVAEGNEVVLTDGDKPLARLVPVDGVNGDGDAPKQRIAGLHEGAIWTSDDFDAELPDEFWLGTT